MVLLPLAILAGLASGIGYFRLQQGPVSVNFLVEPIKQGIDQGLPGLKATFDDVILTLAETGGLELRLKNLHLKETTGDTVISAPQAAIELNAGALWGLEAAPERVELIEPRISLLYSRKGGLSLDFDADEAGPPASPPAGGLRPAKATASDGVDLASVIASTVRYAREAGGASKLREVGLRNATVILDAEGRTSYWQVPRLLVDVERRSEASVVSGAARISSAGRIWTASFRVEDPGAGEALSVTSSIRDVVPRQIAAAIPGVDVLDLFDAPTSADVKAEFNRSGELVGSEVAVEVSGARLQPKGMDGSLLTLDAGVLTFSYDPAAQRIELLPSTLRSGETILQLQGQAAALAEESPGQAPGWGFEIRASPAVLGDPASAAGAVALRSGVARGRYVSAQRRLLIDAVNVDLSGGSITLSGEIDAGAVQGARIEGGFTGMPVSELAAIWPRGLASGGRGWLRDNIRAGQVTTGTISYLSGTHLGPALAKDPAIESRFVIAMEAGNLVFDALKGMPPVSAARALARFENEILEITLPEAAMDVGSARIRLSNGKFVGSDMLGAAPSGQVSFTFEGPAQALLELRQTPAFAHAVKGERMPSGLSGKVAGEAAIGFPLAHEIAAEDIGYDIKARLSEGHVTGIFDGNDIKGASLDFHATPQAVDVQGEVLVKGVLAKVNWQRIKDDTAGRQPPVRLTATLDAADRKQLGIGLDDVILGDIPVEMTVEQPGEAGQAVHVRADLTGATLSLGMIAWTKAAGREAFLDFDVIDAGGGGRTLSNFRVTGSDIAIEGKVDIDSKGRPSRFDFPNFSLDLVSRLSVTGKTRGDGVWQIALDGKTYEGRAFFRSLFSVEDRTPSVKAGTREGYDITVKIDKVIGYDDVALRGVSLSMSTRGGNLSALEGRGELSGGQPMAFALSRERQRRLMRVDTSDAGQAFKLVGFYPNMVGGRLRLEVDLDGRGEAEKTGTLWVEAFRVLGDPIISEVVGSADESVPAIARRQQRVVRQAFDFDSLRAPFSVGHGQIVIQDASMNGALLGATLRGKADFKEKTVDLGGTYVFLQGLNNVFAAIPLLGELLSGPRKEGVFGTNYAIRGSMERPQVFVHPLSTIAPGIFREIFQLAPEQQRVSPRENEQGSGAPKSRSSSSPAAVGTPVSPGRTIEGWNSQTRSN